MKAKLSDLVKAGVLEQDDEDVGYYTSYVLGAGFALHVFDDHTYIPIVYVQTIVEDNDVVYFAPNDGEPAVRHSIDSEWTFRVYREIDSLEGITQ